MMKLETALARMFGGDDLASEMIEAALATPEGKALAGVWDAALEAVYYKRTAMTETGIGAMAVGMMGLEQAVDVWDALGDAP